ncbi:MAG: thioredoxin family protein [Chitinophagaceae bacterium]|nr:thioredoxin family protein [Chitinophagaceae bacterium]
MIYAEINAQLLEQAMDYNSYRAMIDELMAEGKTTGTNQGEDLVAYAKLNIARMNRLDKTFALPQNMWHQVQRMPGNLLFLTITEGWCGDAAQIVPVIEKIVAARPGWQHRIILRDENLPVMDHFLTNGKSRSIPVTIVMKADSFDVIGWWGPRPEGAQQVIDDLKAAQAEASVMKEKLHGWYGRDKGASTAAEFVNALQQAFEKPESKSAHQAA